MVKVGASMLARGVAPVGLELQALQPSWRRWRSGWTALALHTVEGSVRGKLFRTTDRENRCS